MEDEYKYKGAMMMAAGLAAASASMAFIPGDRWYDRDRDNRRFIAVEKVADPDKRASRKQKGKARARGKR